MPLETVQIELSEVEPYEGGARFFSWLAYPDAGDATERDRYFQTLVRWSLFEWMEVSEDWRNRPQLIRPAYFSGSDKDHEKILKRGIKRLRERFAVAQHIVLPHLRAIDTGRKYSVNGFEPSVGNMAIQTAAFLGLESGSQSTVESRMWRPTKPVAHAVCAFVVWHQILWEKWGRNPNAKKQLAFMWLPEYVEEVIEISEVFRAQVTEIKAFTLPEAGTIQFVPEWISYEIKTDDLVKPVTGSNNTPSDL